uniref:Chemokine interleukin-8-like domain-containing protein n=1 Tax=Sinocyclocheilus grahami TaxID=75366 RepID=A0A672QWD3_SINGR
EKSDVCAVPGVLLLSVISIDAAQSKCCGEFTDVKIPLKQVASYYWTSSSCARRAIV